MSESIFYSFKKFDENEFFFALRDGYPVTPLHTLIVPQRHIISYFELNPTEHQNLFPFLLGPSLKTCPRWASQLEHFTSVLTIPNELSSNSFIELLSLGIKKLGQPQPASYFENDSNKFSPQQIHL